MITNKEPSTDRDKILAKLNDVPGHIGTLKSFNDFNMALNSHFAALSKLNRIGY